MQDDDERAEFKPRDITLRRIFVLCAAGFFFFLAGVLIALKGDILVIAATSLAAAGLLWVAVRYLPPPGKP
jgi:hypothetical protein